MSTGPPPGRPISPGVGFQSRNSTASLFLGSVKKSWMGSTGDSSQQRYRQGSTNTTLPKVRCAPQPDATLPSVVHTASAVAPDQDSSIGLPNPSLSPAPSSCIAGLPSVPEGNADELSHTDSTTCSPPKATGKELGGTGPPPAPKPSVTSSEAEPVTPLAPAPSRAQKPRNVVSMPFPNLFGHQDKSSTDDLFWSSLVSRTEPLARLSNVTSRVPDKGDWPRARLLHEACIDRDLLYLAFHQVYCLHTTSPSKLNALGFSTLSVRGLNAIQELLMPNKALSPSFLNWSADFPFSVQVMCHPSYRHALVQASRCLCCFAERWESFDARIRQRAYPPLIDEVIYEFGVNSSVLLTVIFLSMCRRIYGSVNEEPLYKLFLQDKRNYQRRFERKPVLPEQVEQDNMKMVQQYKAIRMQLTTLGILPTKARSSAQIQRRALKRGNFPETSAATPGALTLSEKASASSETHRPVQANQLTSVRAKTICRPPMVMTLPGPNISVGFTQNPVSAPRYLSREPRNTDGLGAQQLQVIPREHVASTRQTMFSMPIVTPEQINSSAEVVSSGQQQQAPRHLSLLPPPGQPPPNVLRPNPLRLALHQAHLRDPIKKLIQREAETESEVDLFQYLSSFTVPPTTLGRTECVFSWEFSLKSADKEKFPFRIESPTGQRALRIFTRGCRVYHLRCIKTSPLVEEIGEQEWSVADTTWPSVFYIFVNGIEHFARRKAHHGRDLPIDITDALKEGENKISLYFLRSAAECSDTLYSLGVEVMDISDYAQVKDLVRSVPATDTNSRIRKQLSFGDTADELSIVNDDISVDLLDPFTARVFDVPARGSFCRHLECFDLETFLATRASKSGKGPMEHDWRCPICREDARPQSLIVDAYLIDVRARLVQDGQIEDAKGIRIKRDGSWELQTDQDNQASEAPRDHGRSSAGMKLKRKRGDGGTDSPAFEQRPRRLKLDNSSRPLHGNLQAPEVIELE